MVVYLEMTVVWDIYDLSRFLLVICGIKAYILRFGVCGHSALLLKHIHSLGRNGIAYLLLQHFDFTIDRKLVNFKMSAHVHIGTMIE